MKKILFGILLFMLIFVMTSCSSESDMDDNKLIVSIEPVQTMLNSIVGDKYEVFSVIPSNASPETYSPTIEDMKNIDGASIFFGVGVPAEESNIINKLNEKTKIISLNDSVTSLYFSNNARDPHIWMSISRVKLMMSSMLEEVLLLNPAYKNEFTTNLNNYFTKLDDCSLTINNIFSDTDKTEFITYHPSLNYFADEFNLTPYTIQKEGQEASSKQLADTIELAKEKSFNTVFYQDSVNSNQVEIFANEIGAKTVVYDPLSSDYINNLIAIANSIRGSFDE